jgi:hypothetical protein
MIGRIDSLIKIDLPESMVTDIPRPQLRRLFKGFARL